jgi:hypothetical protein
MVILYHIFTKKPLHLFKSTRTPAHALNPLPNKPPRDAHKGSTQHPPWLHRPEASTRRRPVASHASPRVGKLGRGSRGLRRARSRTSFHSRLSVPPASVSLPASQVTPLLIDICNPRKAHSDHNQSMAHNDLACARLWPRRSQPTHIIVYPSRRCGLPVGCLVIATLLPLRP